MVYRKISRDVKIAAIKLRERGHLPFKEILACVGFSLLHLWRTIGDVVSNKKNLGCPRLLHTDDVDYLLWLVQHNPDWYLDELLRLLETNRFISVHYVSQYQPEQLGFLDETSKNNKTPQRRCGGLMHRVQYFEFLEHHVVSLPYYSA
ncbi:hypothetical protein B0H11DRAFT_2158665 [Mycena galericulata]|nr:hypothetical protein B0H11DRAFT_2158665 [Mycena galericulata]